MSEREQELPEGIVDGIAINGSYSHSMGGFSVWSSVAHFDDYSHFEQLPHAGQADETLRQFTEYKAWKLAQQTAKVKELRERLRENFGMTPMTTR